MKVLGSWTPQLESHLRLCCPFCFAGLRAMAGAVLLCQWHHLQASLGARPARLVPSLKLLKNVGGLPAWLLPPLKLQLSPHLPLPLADLVGSVLRA